jgi:hypothetical protein
MSIEKALVKLKEEYSSLSFSSLSHAITKALIKLRDSEKRCENVKLFYLDVFSDPIKTNVPNLLD